MLSSLLLENPNEIKKPQCSNFVICLTRFQDHQSPGHKKIVTRRLMISKPSKTYEKILEIDVFFISSGFIEEEKRTSSFVSNIY